MQNQELPKENLSPPSIETKQKSNTQSEKPAESKILFYFLQTF